MMLVTALPALVSATGDKGYIVKVSKYANVRNKPDTGSDSKILGLVKLGSEVEVLGTEEKYTQVTCTTTKGKTVTGYVYSDFVSDTAPTFGKVTVKSTSCNVFTKADTDSDVIGKAVKGDKFDILQNLTNWYKIQYTADTVGYIKKSSASKTTEPGVDTEYSGYGYVTGNTVNVREEATTDSAIKGVAKKNAVYKVVAKNGKWYKIDFEGSELYIHNSLFKVVTNDTDETLVVDCDDTVNVRSTASTSRKAMGKASDGDEFIYIGRSGSWMRIIYNGKVGYIHKNYAYVK